MNIVQKYEIGYQLSDNEFSFTNMVSEFKEHIDTVYFPWIDMASGRASLSNRRGYVEWSAKEILLSDLQELKRQGIKLNILFNGSCYGEDSVSTYLENNIRSVIEYLEINNACPEIVTTCSPIIGEMIKRISKDIKVRASVNMRIGTIKGMEYLAHIFDEYNVQREYNRNLEHLTMLKEWADANEKNLILLANSGCFNFCSAQSFHDNIVSHEKEINERQNVKDWAKPYCRRYLEKKEHWVEILQGSWIRPEDIPNYTHLFPVIKLATRMHANPWIVIEAYTKGNFIGSITDLLEPGFSGEMAPYFLDSNKMPEDWFYRTTTCNKQCHKCSYCKTVLENILTNSQDFYF